MKHHAFPVLIDFNSIYNQRHRDFSRHNAIVRTAAAESRGEATLLIHPRFCEPHLSKPENLSSNWFVQKFIREEPNSKKYWDYLNRVEKYLTYNINSPAFVFYQRDDNSDNLIKWLTRVNPRKSAILVPTLNTGPAPFFDGPEPGNESNAWEKFSWNIFGLGFSKLHIAGELKYKEGYKEIGCVWEAYRRLAGIRWGAKSFEIDIHDDLTYPNISVQRSSSK